ncbi:hypothetical protein L1887_54494 [Cichorium endivia]|nr:hypothetical protein L1887_54494 [Cichorium endivia]
MAGKGERLSIGPTPKALLRGQSDEGRRDGRKEKKKKKPMFDGTSARLRSALDCCGLRLRRATCGTGPPRNGPGRAEEASLAHDSLDGPKADRSPRCSAASYLRLGRARAMCMITSIVLVGTIRFCWRLLCRYNVNEAYFPPTLIMAPFHSETPPCAPTRSYCRRGEASSGRRRPEWKSMIPPFRPASSSGPSVAATQISPRRCFQRYDTTALGNVATFGANPRTGDVQSRSVSDPARKKKEKKKDGKKSPGFSCRGDAAFRLPNRALPAQAPGTKQLRRASAARLFRRYESGSALPPAATVCHTAGLRAQPPHVPEAGDAPQPIRYRFCLAAGFPGHASKAQPRHHLTASPPSSIPDPVP